MESAAVSNHPPVILNPAANRSEMDYFRAAVRSRVFSSQEWFWVCRQGQIWR